MAKNLFSIHFTSKNVLFNLGQNFLSGTKMFCLGQKLFCLGQKTFCLGQKMFCLGRWTGHYLNSDLLNLTQFPVTDVINN